MLNELERFGRKTVVILSLIVRVEYPSNILSLVSNVYFEEIGTNRELSGEFLPALIMLIIIVEKRSIYVSDVIYRVM